MNADIPMLPANGQYVVAFLSSLKSRVTKFNLFNKPYIIVKRNDTEIKIFEDRCPHRGYPLSEGKFVNGQMICSYHGWCFDSEGKCSSISGMDHTPRFKLNEIPFTIKGNLIWAHINKEIEVTFPQKRKILKYRIQKQYLLNAPAYLLIENTLDPMHTPFIHNGLVRYKGKPKEVEIQINSNNNSIESIFTNEGKQNGLISKLFAPKEIHGIGRFIYPSILELEFKSNEKDLLIFSAYLSPVSNNETAVYLNISYNALPMRTDFFLKPIFNMLINKVIQQDIDVCETQFANIKDAKDFIFKSTKLDFMAPYLIELLNKGGLKEEQKKIKILL